MTKIEKANEYIKKNIKNARNRPLYHFTPEIGWINDPNGFSFFKDKYHLFYQYFPYDVRWSDMHWGHATSKDLIKWTYEPVALANDSIYDANGCFSGSAIQKDDKLYLMYTGHVDPNLGFSQNPKQVIQQQCLAISNDGLSFEKYENNPVISQFDLPQGYRKSDFRDPKVLEKNGVYYVVIAVKNLEERGEILLYKSLDLYKWHFVSSIYRSAYEENLMIECPDLFTIDNKDIIIFSGMPCNPVYESTVGNTTEYLVGKMNYITGEYKVEHKDILDYGNSFYAPQSMEDDEGNRIIIGWMKKWLAKSINSPSNLGWSGMMSIPRYLQVKSNKIIQKPFPTILNYIAKQEKITPPTLKEEVIFSEGSLEFNAKFILNAVKTDRIIFTLFENESKSIKVVFDLETSTVYYLSDFENLKESYRIEEVLLDKENFLTVDLYVDKYSMEFFINNGEKVFSFTSFSDKKGDKFKVSSEKSAMVKSIEINLIDI